MLRKIRLPHWSIIPLLISLAIILNAVLMCAFSFNKNRKKIESYFGQTVRIAGVMTEDARKEDNYTKLKINNLLVNNITKCEKCQVYAVLSGVDGAISRSDRVELVGTLVEGNGAYTATITAPILLAHNKPDPPDYAIEIRHKITAKMHDLLSRDASGLALGYLFGDKNSISNDLMDKIRLAGLSHLVVTSGFHLSIIVNIIRRIFGKISRTATLFGITVAILVFISIAGLSASMARAGLMSLLSIIAWYFGRRFHPGRLLVYVASITIAVSPTIITDVGWQLSFASFAGIIIFSPVLAHFLYGDTSPNLVASSLIVSLSAQLFCLPLSIYHFGIFSIVGIVAGIIVAPTIAFLMFLVCLCVLASSICVPHVLSIIIVVTSALLDFHYSIISFSASIPWATIELPTKNALVFIIFIPVLVAFFILKRISKYDFRPSYSLEKSSDYGKIYSC